MKKVQKSMQCDSNNKLLQCTDAGMSLVARPHTHSFSLSFSLTHKYIHTHTQAHSTAFAAHGEPASLLFPFLSGHACLSLLRPALAADPPPRLHEGDPD